MKVDLLYRATIIRKWLHCLRCFLIAVLPLLLVLALVNTSSMATILADCQAGPTTRLTTINCLGWRIVAYFERDGVSDGDDGLILDDIMFQGKRVVGLISNPYIHIQTTDMEEPIRCELSIDNSESERCTSQLSSKLNADLFIADRELIGGEVEFLEISASYDLSVPGGELQLTYYYRFLEETDSCGPPEILQKSCMPFYLDIVYSFQGEAKLEQLELPYRIDIDISSEAEGSTNFGCLVNDSDFAPLEAWSHVDSCNPANVIHYSVGSYMNFLEEESFFMIPSVQQYVQDFESEFDNYHQTNSNDVQVPGCQSISPCLHFHWRWPATFGPIYGNFDPEKEFLGKSLVPNSQFYDGLLVRFHNSAEERDPLDAFELLDYETVAVLQDGVLSGSDTVLWLIATSFPNNHFNEDNQKWEAIDNFFNSDGRAHEAELRWPPMMFYTQ